MDPDQLAHLPEPLVARLRAAGCVFAEEEAALLLAEADGDGDVLEELAAARVAGRPLEQVLGRVELDGCVVRLDPGVFVPRQRSVLLVREAARLAAPAAVVVDLCCGSGALGTAVAARRPDVEVWAADLDPAAVACARRNLPPDRVRAGDLYDALPDALRGRVGVLVANAPYVPHAELAGLPPEARDHEAALALDGGHDGLAVHRRVAEGARDWLAPGGTLLVEVAAGQVERATRLLASYGLGVAVVTDPERDATVLRGTAPGGSTTDGPR